MVHMNEILPKFADLRAVLFDMDGVLTQNTPFHELAWRQATGQQYGIDIPEGDLRIHAGKNSEILQVLLGREVPDEEMQHFHHLKESTYRDLARGSLEPTSGLKAYLNWLQEQNLQVALVTGADRPNVDFVLQALGLTDTFEVQITSEMFERGKPDPTCYLLALEKLGLSPSQVMVHEDSPAGTSAAVAAGCTVLALGTTTTPEVLERKGAAKVFRDFTDLLPFMQQHQSAVTGR